MDDTWSASRILRRLAKAGAIMAGERVAFGLLNLAAAGLAVRAVGVEAFGVVALLMAYARLVGELAQFQSWQALIRFGAPALQEERRARFRALVAWCARLDALTLGAAALAGALAAGPLGRALGWPEAMVALAPWFALTTALIIPNAAHGVLRLFGRIPDIAAQHAIAACVRFTGAGALFLFGGDAAALAAVWAAAGVVSGVWVIWRAWAVLGREGLRPRLSLRGGLPEDDGGAHPGLWRFLWTASFASTVEGAVAHVTTLAVGAMLGATEAGLFTIARQLAEALAKPARLMGPLILPELAWLNARGDRTALRALIARGAALAVAAVAGLGFGFLLGGPWLLRVAFGPEAATALPALALAGAASGFTLIGFALEPALLALGRMRAVTASLLAAVALYAVALATLPPVFGVAGAAAALLAFSAAAFALRAAAAWRALRDPAKPGEAAPGDKPGDRPGA